MKGFLTVTNRQLIYNSNIILQMPNQAYPTQLVVADGSNVVEMNQIWDQFATDCLLGQALALLVSWHMDSINTPWRPQSN